MDDKSFHELQLRSVVCPNLERWPRGDEIHWRLMVQAGIETRSRLSNFLETIAEIDADPRLSGEGKQ